MKHLNYLLGLFIIIVLISIVYDVDGTTTPDCIGDLSCNINQEMKIFNCISQQCGTPGVVSPVDSAKATCMKCVSPIITV